MPSNVRPVWAKLIVNFCAIIKDNNNVWKVMEVTSSGSPKHILIMQFLIFSYKTSKRGKECMRNGQQLHHMLSPKLIKTQNSMV